MSGPIVLTYDGSDGAAQAIASAGRLLAPRRALVVHAYYGLSHMMLRSNMKVHDLDGPLADAVEEFDSADADEAERIAAEGTQLAIAAGLQAQPIVVRQEGKTWQALIAAAVNHDAAVVVAGARGRSALTAALLGSVSRGLAVHSPVALLVVPAESAADDGAGPALLSYEPSSHATNAINVASELLVGKSALVLNVWQSWVMKVPPYLPGVAREFDAISEQLSAESVEEGAGLAAEAGFEPKALSVRAVHSVWRGVLDAADEQDVSAIVVGSRSVGGPLALLGGTADGVIHHAQRPVLVVPPSE